MANTDKLLLITLGVMVLGFVLIIIDTQKRSYEKGVRDGYHRGRSYKGQE